MKRIGLLTFLLFNLNLVIGQVTRGEAERNEVKGVVVDENNKPIPYVNIWFANSNLATTTEADGTFILEVKTPEQDLLFSALGYASKTVKANETARVVLSAIAIPLSEIVLGKPKESQQKELGYYQSGGFRYHQNYFIHAVYFDLAEKDRTFYPYLKEIKFRTDSETDNAKIKIYLVNCEPDGSPGEEKLTEEMIVVVKKGNRKNLIDLSEQLVKIPENGFFIVFEKLKIEENKHYITYNYKDKNGEKKTHQGLTYQPELLLTPFDDAKAWFKEKQNQWTKSTKVVLNKPNSYENLLMKKYHNKYLLPAVNITITN